MKSLMEPIYNFFLEPLDSYIPKEESGLNKFYSLRDVDNESLLQVIGHAVKLLRLHEIDNAYHVLNNPDWKLNNIEPEILIKYYYLMTVISIERYELMELEKNIKKLTDQLQHMDGLDDQWKQHINLLNLTSEALHESKGWPEKVSQLFSKDINLKPKFSFALYFGSLARDQEFFEEASFLLEKALAYARDDIEKAVVYCNLGQLFFLLDDLEASFQHYENAEGIIARMLENDSDSTLNLYLREIQRNKIIIKELILEKNEMWHQTEKMPKIVESEMELAHKWEDIALSYINDEIYEENLASRNTIRFSNNMYEAIRYFNKSEIAYSLLGNVSAKLFKQEIKAFLNAGYIKDDSRLLRIALEQAIEIDETKVINKLIGDTIPFKTTKDLEEFCEWLFKPTKVRRKMLGRINCMTVLCDYLPDDYIPAALDIAKEALSKRASFFKEYDFKRPGIKLIGAIIPRISNEEKEEMIKRLWKEFEDDNHLVRYDIAQQLSGIDCWNCISKECLEELAEKILRFLESNEKDKDIWSSKLFDTLINLSEFLPEKMQNKIATFIINGIKEKDTDCFMALSNEWLQKYISEELYIQVVNYIITSMKNKIAEENDHHRSIGAFEWGALLGIYISKIEGTRQIEALQALIDYINADNLMAYSRAAALHNLILFLNKDENKEILNKFRNSLKDICLRCLQSIPKKRHESLMPDLEDEDILTAKAAWCLVMLDIEVPETVINLMIRRCISAESNGLRESLLFLGRSINKFVSDEKLLKEILGIFIGEIKNQDERVRSVLAYYIPCFANNDKHDFYWEYVKEAINIFSNDRSRIVRLNLAYSIKDNLALWPARYKFEVKSVLECLKNDLSFKVRMAVGEWDHEC